MGQAISSGSHIRPRGVIRRMFSVWASVRMPIVRGVFTLAGATAFTVMPWGPSSRAACRVRPRTPVFAEV